MTPARIRNRNTHRMISRLMAGLLLAMAFMLMPTGPAKAQMKADLRSYEEVQPAEPLAIDGIWRLQELNRQILIENGHVIVLEGWTHMFAFAVERGMVTSTDLRQTGPNTFSAYDALLKRQMEWTVREDGTIMASGGAGLFAPRFSMRPVDLAYPEAFEEVRQGFLSPPQPGPLPAPLPVSPLPGPPLPEAAPDAGDGDEGRPGPIDLDPAMTGPIKNRTGKCLSLNGPDQVIQGGKIQVWECTDTTSQGFLFLQDDGLIVSASGMCLEAVGSGNGALVRSYGCDGNDAQKWTVLTFPIIGSRIQNESTGLCLEIHRADSKKDGGQVQLWECKGDRFQQWTL